MAGKKFEKKDAPKGVIARIGLHRPVIEYVIMSLALLGVLVVIHLWIQTGRGFDRGCFGFSAPSPTFNCEAVIQSDAGRLFGISNVFWGLFYYLALVAMTFIAAILPVAGAARLRQVRNVSIAFGFLYSGYLVSVQFFRIGEFCALCLTSALIAASLICVLGFSLKTDPRALAGRKGASTVKRFTTMIVGLLIVAALDVGYFKRLELPTTAPSVHATAASVGQRSGNAEIENTCRYNPNYPAFKNVTRLYNIGDPYEGNPAAPVTVIELFDPNCPHCKAMHPLMKKIIASESDHARFYLIPFVIFKPSGLQTEALYVAAHEDKYFEMVDAQFARQKKEGLSLAELTEMAKELGMDPVKFEEAIRRGTNRAVWQQTRETVVEMGIKGVPTVMINGRVVDGDSRSVSCIDHLIEEAAAS